MIDFLRANTWCSQEEYKWGMSLPQVRLAGMDFTRIEYLTEKERQNIGDNKDKTVNGGDDLKNLNDLGIPII